MAKAKHLNLLDQGGKTRQNNFKVNTLLSPPAVQVEFTTIKLMEIDHEIFQKN